MPNAWFDDGSVYDPKRGKVLLYLLQRVGKETSKVYGHILHPGQVFVGSRKAAMDLNIPHATFDRYVKRYEKEGKLRRQPMRNGTIITIVPIMTWEENKRFNKPKTEAHSETLSGAQSGDKLERKNISNKINDSHFNEVHRTKDKTLSSADRYVIEHYGKRR